MDLRKSEKKSIKGMKYVYSRDCLCSLNAFLIICIVYRGNTIVAVSENAESFGQYYCDIKTHQYMSV